MLSGTLGKVLEGGEVGLKKEGGKEAQENCPGIE